MPKVSETMPVTLEAAEKEPILSGRSAYFSSCSASSSWSMRPSASSWMVTTSAIGLAPRDLVGVVLVGAEEHHRSLRRRDVRGQVVLVVEHRRDPQAEDADQLGDRARAAGPGEQHHRVVVAPDGLADDLAGLLAQSGGLQTGPAGLGVGVGIARQHLVADEVLEEGERPAGGGVVGVGDPALPVRRGHHVVLADHGLAHERDQGRCPCGHAARVEPNGANHPTEMC